MSNHELEKGREISQEQSLALQADIKNNLTLNEGLIWIFGYEQPGYEAITVATYDPQLYKPLRELTDIVSMYGLNTPYDIGMPLRYEEGTLTTPQRLTLALEVLRKRRDIETKFTETFGTTTFFVQLGELSPMEFTLSSEICTGAARMHLWDATKYDKGSRIYLGMVDFDTQQDEVTLTLMQDDSGVVDHQGNVPNKRNLTTVAATRKRKIRKNVRSDRTVVPDPFEDENSGLEELMAYLTSDVLLRSGLISKNATILIPKPEYTYWSSVGLSEAIYKTMGKGLIKQPQLIMEQLKTLIGEDYAESMNEGYATVGYTVTHELLVTEPEQKNILTTDSGEQFSVEEYLLGVFFSELPPESQPSVEELRGYTLADPSERYRLLSHLAYRSAAYLRTFHAYRTAFQDVPHQDRELGRNLRLDDIQKLPFVNRVRIMPQDKTEQESDTRKK